MNRILVFVAIAEFLALVGLWTALDHHARHRNELANARERIRLLEAHRSVCVQYVRLAERSSRTETNLRVGYARVVERVFSRLGLTGFIPGANEELLKELLKDKKDGNSDEIQGDLRESMGGQ